MFEKLKATIERSTVIASAIPIAMTAWYRYEEHWWWDNTAHFAGGYAVGDFVSNFTETRKQTLLAFTGVAACWELFEYCIGERPWDGSMCWDHAMEDTLLDTIMGAVGAYYAAKHNDQE